MSTQNTSVSKTEEHKIKLIHRLKRLEGQVRGLQKMVEEERDCQEILTLLSGIRSALDATGDMILSNYLQKCQADIKRGKAPVESILEAVKLARG